MDQLFQKPHFVTNSQYVGVSTGIDDFSSGSSLDYEKTEYAPQELNLETHPQLHGRRSWFKTAVIQGFCALWLCPMALLLVFNLNGHIIGASAWCPGGKCYPRLYDTPSSLPQNLRAKYDHETHNLLGALQLVAKALEIWFIMIVTWFVYLITMFLASRKSGLPIAYITRPNEYSEFPSNFDPLLWRALPSPFRLNRPKTARLRVWIFLLSTVFLGILCNSMGPATAVLVIPSLQWLETDLWLDGVFVQQNAAVPPAHGNFLWNTTPGCSQSDFDGGLWSCTSKPFAPMLDAWVESYTASQLLTQGITQQSLVTFIFNSTEWIWDDGTTSDYLAWAPSRQVIENLNWDLANTMATSLGVTSELLSLEKQDVIDSYAPYNNTVATSIQRNGPVTGVASNMWLGYDNTTWWDTMLDNETAVRCYENYNVSNTPLHRGELYGIFTKCVKWGDGWNMDYKYGTFNIEGMYKPWLSAFGPNAKFDIWTSDRAAFLPHGRLPTGFPSECLPRNDYVPSGVTCDWDMFFEINPKSTIASRAAEVNTVQISTSYEPVEGHPTSLALMFDFVAFVNFTMYAFDPSPVTNPINLATFPELPMGGNAIPVDPAWTLAAWSADNGGTIGANRSATLAVLRAFDQFWSTAIYNDPDPLNASYPSIDYIALIPILQTLSLVDHEIDRAGSQTVDADHPKLERNARINVWAYGMSSRTSWFGVTVVGIGILVVVSQCFLGTIDRRPYRSPTELLVAALEHSPGQEFHGTAHDELAIARTPFRVEHSLQGHASTFKFEHPGRA